MTSKVRQTVSNITDEIYLSFVWKGSIKTVKNSFSSPATKILHQPHFQYYSQ
jgi:hypothetical protein